MSYKQRQMAKKNSIIKMLNEVKRIKTILQQAPEDEKRIFNEIIDEWYDSYKDRTTDYSPLGSLKNAYVFHPYDKENEEVPDPSEDKDLGGVSHHQRNNEIIFNNAFLAGYHGGSWGKGLSKKVPHYRKGMNYSHWGRKAVSTYSPRERTDSAIKNYEKPKQREIDDAIRHLDSLVSEYKKQYHLQ